MRRDQQRRSCGRDLPQQRCLAMWAPRTRSASAWSQRGAGLVASCAYRCRLAATLFSGRLMSDSSRGRTPAGREGGGLAALRHHRVPHRRQAERQRDLLAQAGRRVCRAPATQERVSVWVLVQPLCSAQCDGSFNRRMCADLGGHEDFGGYEAGPLRRMHSAHGLRCMVSNPAQQTCLQQENGIKRLGIRGAAAPGEHHDVARPHDNVHRLQQA